MASAIAAILIVPWAALQRSHAQSDFAGTILRIHNDERAAVGSPALKWSESLASDAKLWAEHLASLPPTPSGGPDLSHSPREQRNPPGQGENIAAAGANGAATTEALVNTWTSEKSNVKPGANVNGLFGDVCASGTVCGHYLQMVSRYHTDVGCATTKNDKFEFLVCRYITIK